MKTECRTAREALIDEALGQAGASAIAPARAHVERCAECRAEVDALRATIERVRRHGALAPSKGFRARVSAALDQVDARAAARARQRERVAARAVDGVRFRLVLLGHQLRTSRKWRLRVAAALLPFAVGVGLLLAERLRGGGSSPEVCELPAPPPEDPASPPAPRDATPQSLVEWRPQLDEPVEPAPARPPPSFEELDEVKRQRATEELVKLNRIEAETLARLREIQRKQPEREAAPRKDPAREEAAAAPDVAPPARRALDWLARNQRADGSWTSGGGEPGLDTGVTALALLALLSEGQPASEPADSALARATAAAAAYLQARQDPRDGRFRGGSDEAAQIFCHATACLALVEHRVRALAAGAVDPAATRDEHDRLERALTQLEMDLDALLHDRASPRCAGQNVAWVALALTTARHCGVDFHLNPNGEAQIERVLERLRGDHPALMLAASHTISVMAGRDPKTPSGVDLAWARAVGDVRERPDRVEPSLRFLVASALCAAQAPRPGRRGVAHPRRDEWRLFQATLEERLLRLQSPDSGWFDSGVVWECYGGGTVYETALAVLALRVGRRHDDFEAARARLLKR